MLINKEIKVRWNPNNKKYYESLGYIFTKCNEYFYIQQKDVLKTSGTKLDVQCDYCGDIFHPSADNYFKRKDKTKDCCQKCKPIKTKESVFDKYGVESISSIPGVREKTVNTCLKKYGSKSCLSNSEIKKKVSETCLKKYGVPTVGKSKEVHEKSKQTNIDKYGYECVFSVPEIRDRIKQTNFDKYGFDNAAKNKDVIEKAKKTCIERYGGESTQCSEEVRAKTIMTLRKNGYSQASKPEKETISLLKEIYGEENCFEQYQFKRWKYDCLLTIQGIKIDFEYDGKFWHELSAEKDSIRDSESIKSGIKVFRVIGGIEIPTKEQLIHGVEILTKTNTVFYSIDITDTEMFLQDEDII